MRKKLTVCCTAFLLALSLTVPALAASGAFQDVPETADSFDYWIAYSGNEKRMETFRNAAPQTWVYFEALEKNNWSG